MHLVPCGTDGEVARACGERKTCVIVPLSSEMTAAARARARARPGRRAQKPSLAAVAEV